MKSISPTLAARVKEAALRNELDELESRVRKFVAWCEWCGLPFQGHLGRGRPRKFCSGVHKNRYMVWHFKNKNRPLNEQKKWVRPKVIKPGGAYSDRAYDIRELLGYETIYCSIDL